MFCCPPLTPVPTGGDEDNASLSSITHLGHTQSSEPRALIGDSLTRQGASRPPKTRFLSYEDRFRVCSYFCQHLLMETVQRCTQEPMGKHLKTVKRSERTENKGDFRVSEQLKRPGSRIKAWDGAQTVTRAVSQPALQRLIPEQRASGLWERSPCLCKDGNMFQISDAHMEIVAVRLDLWLRDCRRPARHFRRGTRPFILSECGCEAPEQHWHQGFSWRLTKT